MRLFGFQQVSTMTTKVDIEELDMSRINTKHFRPKSLKSYGTLRQIRFKYLNDCVSNDFLSDFEY